jgi:hypothetical protein
MSDAWINDIDLADYGFVMGQDAGHAESPQFSDPSAALLGALGATWLSEPTQAAPRRIVVGGNVKQASAALYRAAIDQVKGLATQGAVRVRFADHTDQEFRDCRLVDFKAVPRAALLSNLAGDVVMQFEAADPLRYDVNPQGIPLSTSRASLPIGTAPSFPLIRIHGGGATVTGPIVITVRNAGGDSVQTFTISVTSLSGSVLGANDYIDIDGTRIRMVKSLAGTQSDGGALWSAGDFPVIRPADGNWELLEYPTMELSANSGTPVGLCTYARAWL